MSIESDIAWLTLDKGARLAGKYLDQMKQQIDDCCAEGDADRERIKSEVAAVNGQVQAGLSELTPLLRELRSLREELTVTLATLKKPAEPTTPR